MKQAYLAIILILAFRVSAQVPDWAWAKTNSGAADCEARSMAVDQSGNVYVTGYFSGSSAVFASTTLTNSGTPGSGDYFLLKFDRTGALQWAKRAVGSDDDEGLSVTCDASGNVYTTGSFESPTITFGTTVLTNNSAVGLADVFIVKYNSAGNVLWASAFGGNQSETGNAIQCDASGNVYLLGDFLSLSVQFGSYGVINGGAGDIFFTKFNSGGTPLWAKRIGGGQLDSGRDLTTDASGNIAVFGEFASSSMATFSPALVNAGGSDIFLARYDGAGNILSASRYGGSNDEFAFAMTSNTSGELFISGSFNSSALVLGSASLSNSGNKDIFFAKFNSSATTTQWANKANANAGTVVLDLITDASGNLYSSGRFNVSALTFTNVTALTNSGGFDGFLVKFNSSTGAGIWAKQTSSSGDEKLSGVAVGPDGFVVVSGAFTNSLTLGQNPLTGGTGMYSLVAKLCFAPSPPVSASGATVCAGAAGQLSAVVPPGTTAWWFNAATGGSPLMSGTAYTPTTSGVYYVATRDTNSGCGMYSATRISATLSLKPPVNAGVTVSGHTLTATGQGTVTAWYDCDKKTNINGQTTGNYVITASGSYAVIMSSGGCSDTSACDVYSYTPGTPTVIVINTALQENAATVAFKVYPNPSAGTFTFKAQIGKYKMYNLLGEIVSTIEITEENTSGVILSGFSDGMYFISDYSNTSCLRVIVNR